MYRFKDFRFLDFGGVSGEPYFDNTRLLGFFFRICLNPGVSLCKYYVHCPLKIGQEGLCFVEQRRGLYFWFRV